MPTPTNDKRHAVAYDPMPEYDPNTTPKRRRRTEPDAEPDTVADPRPDDTPRAKREPRRKRQQPTPARPAFIEFFCDRRTHMALGVILVAIAVVTLLASVSYLKNGAEDFSTIAGNSITEIAESNADVANVGGPVGAKLSHKLIAGWFGVGAFVLVVYIGVLGLALLGIMKCRFWNFTFRCLFTATAISIIAGLLSWDADTFFSWGGAHGRQVNAWLINYSDVLGAIAVSVVLAGCLVCIYLNELIRFTRFCKAKAASAKAARAARNTAMRPDRDKPVSLDDVTPDGSSTPADSAISGNTSPLTPGDTSSTTADDSDTGGFAIDATLVTPAAASSQLPARGDANKPGDSNEDVELVINKTDDHETDTADAANDATAAAAEPYDHRAELSRYRFPGLDLLIDRPSRSIVDENEQQANKDMIVNTLKSYGITISKIEATIGPTVTLYEIVPAEGVRISQIKTLEDDIQLSLAAMGIRIIAPIPGKSSIGIEVPNKKPQTVAFRTVVNSRKYRECRMALPMALGATISNDIFIEDLTKMPHLLVAGATGQGKSVGLNCIIASLLYKKHPSELKFVLVDPKMVEFSLYAKLERHYLAKLPDEERAIITEPSKAVATLSSLCIEMDHRYELLTDAGVRGIDEYNKKFSQRRLNPEKGHAYMPYIVVVVDEFADLIAVAGKDVLMYISRIAAKARAVGIHMIIATQRPSTDVITGVIKANFPGRIAFRVSAMVDSKTILDRPGANRLIGRGDMLFSHNGKVERVQCAFIDTDEVEAIANHIDNQIGYETAYLLPPVAGPDDGSGPIVFDPARRDDKFDVCARFVVESPTASTSSLQRRFGIGYNKAGKIMDQLEAAGIVGAADGSKPRQVLVDAQQLERILQSF